MNTRDSKAVIRGYNYAKKCHLEEKPQPDVSGMPKLFVQGVKMFQDELKNLAKGVNKE